jgi:hypothetical protein
MSAEDVIEDLLREHREASEDRDRQERVWVSAKRESLSRLLDAAIEVLGATERLLSVAEDLLREQRERLAAPPPEPPDDGHEERAERPRRIDLTY